jgi:hypothetical protein
MGRERHGQALGQSDNAEFGRRIRNQIRHAAPGGTRANRDDLAALTLPHHVFGCRLRAQKRAGEIHRQHASKHCFGQGERIGVAVR